MNTFRLTCVKLTTRLENVKGVVHSMTFLSLRLVEIDKNYWWTLPRWNSLCHRLSRDQPQPGSVFQRPREAEKRDPGNEVASSWENLVMTSAYERPYVRPYRLGGRWRGVSRYSSRSPILETKERHLSLAFFCLVKSEKHFFLFATSTNDRRGWSNVSR